MLETAFQRSHNLTAREVALVSELSGLSQAQVRLSLTTPLAALTPQVRVWVSSSPPFTASPPHCAVASASPHAPHRCLLHQKLPYCFQRCTVPLSPFLKRATVYCLDLFTPPTCQCGTFDPAPLTLCL